MSNKFKLTEEETLKNAKMIQLTVSLTNGYIDEFIKNINPREFEGSESGFIRIAMGSPAMISSEIIDRLAKAFKVNRKDVLKEFKLSLDLALRHIDAR